MIHQIVWSVYPVERLVHVADLGAGIFVDGISHPGKCPVLIETAAWAPIDWVEMDKDLIRQHQAKVGCLREWYQHPGQLPETITGIATGRFPVFYPAFFKAGAEGERRIENANLISIAPR